MKFTHFLPLAALAGAFILPDQDTFNDVFIEGQEKSSALLDKVPSKNELLAELDQALQSTKPKVESVHDCAQDMFDNFLESASETSENAYSKGYDEAYDAEGWLTSSVFDEEPDEASPHSRPRKRPHHRPHHGHRKTDQTIYQLISESKYTTKLAKLIEEDDELVDILNGTAANYTVFAPTDKAFDKIPKGAPKPSKEQLRALLEYHISPEFYPAGRVLKTHTIGTLLKSSSLGEEPLPQRLSVNVGFRGLTLDFYSRIIAANFFTSNGVIHGVDSLILPPPRAIKIIDLFPGEFSTLELGLSKTGLLDSLNTTDHPGGTLFAPSNGAFQKLGPKINAFLFSSYGLKYLKALLEYHVAPSNTLYSDAFYDGKSGDSSELRTAPRRSYFHFDLPTLLGDRTLAVDVTRFGPFISIKVNAFSRVTIQDGVAKDGVVHVVSNVLVPPKQPGGPGDDDDDEVDPEDCAEMAVEDFCARLEPYVTSVP